MKTMEMDEYQIEAARTARFDQLCIEPLIYTALGLSGEAGEVVEKIKKVVRNDNGVMSPKKRDEIKKELGDVLWYISQMARLLDITLSDVARTNIAKLSSRDLRGVICKEGDTR